MNAVAESERLPARPKGEHAMRLRGTFLGLLVTASLLLFGSPASLAQPVGSVSARSPDATITWSFGTPSLFNATRFDGAYVHFLNRVYFLGFRTDGDLTDGYIWYYDVNTDTYVDTGLDMPEPVSNYQIAALEDDTGLGLYIFGGRNANAELVDTVQVFYPSTNSSSIVTTDPWPGRTPSGCVSLPAMGVATVNNRAVVMGGVSFTANGCLDESSAQTWIYSPRAAAGSRWSQGPDLNVARGYITPAVRGGTVYAIGGDVNVAGTLTPQVTVEKLTSRNGSWDDAGVADLPVACDESQAFAPPSGSFAAGVVLAGCGQWPNALPDTYFLDVNGNVWALVGYLNEIRRNQAGSFVKAFGTVYMGVLGGYGSDGFTPLNSLEISTTLSGPINPQRSTGQASADASTS
jgi:hypothetical protein